MLNWVLYILCMYFMSLQCAIKRWESVWSNQSMNQYNSVITDPRSTSVCSAEHGWQTWNVYGTAENLHAVCALSNGFMGHWVWGHNLCVCVCVCVWLKIKVSSPLYVIKLYYISWRTYACPLWLCALPLYRASFSPPSLPLAISISLPLILPTTQSPSSHPLSTIPLLKSKV